MDRFTARTFGGNLIFEDLKEVCARIPYAERMAGKTVLVTGATGRVGS